LLKQAAGQEPVTGNADWYEEPTRQFYADIFQFNRDYHKALDLAHRPMLKQLYTSESYASRAAMTKTIAELQAALQVDKQYDSMEPLFLRFEAGIRASAAATQRQQEDFIRGVHSTSDKIFSIRNETFRRAEQWLQASIDLYEFTLAHSK